MKSIISIFLFLFLSIGAFSQVINGTISPSCSNDGGITITFDATSAPLTAVRYIRVQQNEVDWLHLSELRAIEAFTGTNVALNKSVATESNYAGYPIFSLVDGNLTTFSHSGSAGTNQFVEIDLGATYLLDRIEIVNRFDAAQERSDNLQLSLKDASGNTVHTRQIDAYQGQTGAFQTDWNVTDVSWADGATTLNRSNLAIGTYTLNYSDVSNVTSSPNFAVNAPTSTLTPAVSIAASASSVAIGTSVTFTATPTNGGSTPTYQWKKNGNPIGTNSATYTDATLADGDNITVEMVSSSTCASAAPVTSNTVTMTVTVPTFLAATYTAGDIPTNPLSFSASCVGTMSITLPTGNNWIVQSVDVTYNMTAVGQGWKSEQRSRIYCQNTNTAEANFAAGTGQSVGTVSYSRTGLNIANGTYNGGDVLTFEIQAFRTFTSEPGCNTLVNKVDNGTWTVTVNVTIPCTNTITPSVSIAASASSVTTRYFRNFYGNTNQRRQRTDVSMEKERQ